MYIEVLVRVCKAVHVTLRKCLDSVEWCVRVALPVVLLVYFTVCCVHSQINEDYEGSSGAAPPPAHAIRDGFQCVIWWLHCGGLHDDGHIQLPDIHQTMPVGYIQETKLMWFIQ